MLRNQLNVGINYTGLRRRLTIKFVGFLVAVLAIQTFSVATVNFTGFFKSLVFHLTFPMIFTGIRCSQNMFYVDLIREVLNLVNKKLEEIVAHKRDKMAFILFANELQKCSKKVGETSLYHQVMALKRIYEKIWDITNLINKCFGWSLLAIVNIMNMHVET